MTTTADEAGSGQTVPMATAWRDPERLAKTIVSLLWTEIGLSLFAILGEAWNFTVLGRVRAEAFASYEDAEAARAMSEGVVGLVALAQVALAILLGVLILMWIYRSSKNSRALGARNMEYSPGWAVGWYFVPFMNLWKPYDAFREIWQRNVRGSGDTTVKETNLLGRWWGLWITVNILQQVASKMWDAGQEDLELASWASIASVVASGFSILLDLVFIQLVRHLTRMQLDWRVSTDTLQPADGG